MDQKRKKKLILKYEKKEPFTKADEKWMDENDWHPVDEKPMKPSFIKELQRRSKERSFPVKNIKDLFECPQLDEVLLVEKTIKDGDYPTEAQLYKKIGKKVTKRKIRTIVDYLETKGKVLVCKDGAIVWAWDPKRIKETRRKGLIIK